MYRRLGACSCWLLLVLTSLGCGRKPVADQADSTEKQKAPGLFDRVGAKPVVVPAGTVITVRLGQTVGSKTSNSGDSFDATVAEPVQVNGKAVVPSGVPASGHVAEAAPDRIRRVVWFRRVSDVRIIRAAPA